MAKRKFSRLLPGLKVSWKDTRLPVEKRVWKTGYVVSSNDTCFIVKSEVGKVYSDGSLEPHLPSSDLGILLISEVQIISLCKI